MGTGLGYGHPLKAQISLESHLQGARGILLTPNLHLLVMGQESAPHPTPYPGHVPVPAPGHQALPCSKPRPGSQAALWPRRE